MSPKSQRDAFDARCLEKLRGGGWISACDVARGVGVSYQCVAKAMQRLFADGRVEVKIITVKTKSRGGGEQRRLYRIRTGLFATGVSWLDGNIQLPSGSARMVFGYAGTLKRA